MRKSSSATEVALARAAGLWKRSCAALLLTAAFAAGSHVLTERALVAADESARLLNVSGRQRMLSQRILQLHRLDQLGGLDGEEEEALQRSLRFFERSYWALRRGGDLGLSEDSVAHRAYLYETRLNGVTLHQLVERFVDDVRAVQAEDEGRVDAARARLDSLYETDALLRRLDQVVADLERDADRMAARVQLISRGSFYGLLLLLALQGLLVVYPSHRFIVAALRRAAIAERKAQRSTDRIRASLNAEKHARTETERLLQSRSAVFANLSHEMRTPLTILIGFLDMLRTQPLDAAQQRMIGLSRKAAGQVLTIVNDLLDFRKIEENMMVLSRDEIVVQSFVDRQMALFESRAADEKLALASSIDPALPPAIILDETRLTQVLNNLMGNALKFTERGSVSLTVRASSEGFIAFSVTDTGPGIEPDEMERLFRPFEQGHTNAPSRVRGTGLGLTISKEIAAIMGGELTAVSVPGRGSTFSLRLPLVTAEDQAADEAAA